LNLKKKTSLPLAHETGAFKILQDALDAISKEKEEIAAQLADAVTEISRQMEEKERQLEAMAELNQKLAGEVEDNKRKSAELKAVNQELESFSYSVSHDLRTPLRAIYGFSHILSEEYVQQLDAEGQALFSEIIYNTKKMGQLIDNLLEFSRLTKQKAVKNETNVTELVHDVVLELRQLEPERAIDISIRDLPEVPADAAMLRQLFINLISNAMKYTGKKDKAVIDIGSYTEGNNVVYYIKDNGAGFDPRYGHMLFGVFQRLHSSNEFEGTGVGLAIAEKIVKKHGGEIWAEGEVDKGAQFYISLPLQIEE